MKEFTARYALADLLELLSGARRAYAQSTEPTPDEIRFSRAYDALSEWLASNPVSRQALKESGDN